MKDGDRLRFNTSMTFSYGVPSDMGSSVARIVAENPGPFTFKGTNTYLVGDRSLAVIDPGPDDERHCAAILAAAAGRRITHIFVTHTHRDHVDGLTRLKAATGALSCGHLRSDASRGTIASSPSGREFVDLDFKPDVHLADGERIAGDGFAITALHTPGHAPDHLCFALEGTGLVFSGDHVMAWNTSVIAPPEGNMADYMRSLEMLLDRDDRTLLPGHGGRIHEPQRTVKAYLLHRRWRENAILDAVRSGVTTIRTIVPVVYPGIDGRLAMAAALSVRAHVEHLLERGLLVCQPPVSLDQTLSVAC
jgi:glyoxylase-like metal-dependent hydrolase (beta-lactamase superfamily II)